MITNEAAWLRRVLAEPLDDAQNHRRLESALVALLRLSDYARFLDRNQHEMSGRLDLLMRERREWKQLFERATKRADKAEALLRELANGAPESARVVALEAARAKLDDKLTEVLKSHELRYQRCLALESKLKIVEASK